MSQTSDDSILTSLVNLQEYNITEIRRPLPAAALR